MPPSSSSPRLSLSALDARPRLALRLGVSGHRAFEPEATAQLSAIVTDLIAQVQAAMSQVHGAPARRSFFSDAEPVLHVVSPLAEGADRIVAEAALSRSARLAAALPFVESAYGQDFPQTVPVFDRLLGAAQASGGVVVLDTAPGNAHERNQCYLAAGLFTVRNCDLLIAIWDGQPAAGLGGTAEVVAYACEHGVPVLHIASKAPHAMHLLDGRAEPQALTPDLLNARVRQILWPQSIAAADHGEHEILSRPVTAATYLTGERVKDTGTQPDFLYQGPYAAAPNRLEARLSRIFPIIINWFRSTDDLPPLDKTPPHKSETTDYLYRHYQRADALASFYSNLHRSVYVAVYQLSAFALIAAIIAQASGALTAKLFLILELVLLLTTLTLILADRWYSWRARWLSYRLLAETLRNADVMNQMGRPTPFMQIDQLYDELPSHGWVVDVYKALIRETGTCPVRFDDDLVARIRRYVKDVRVEDQIRYHHATARRNRLAARRIAQAGILSFFVTLAAVTAKVFALGAFIWPPFPSIMAVIAYGLFAIRNQAEFEIVSERSIGMAQKLKRASEGLAPLRDAALNSDFIARQTLTINSIMRHEAADWASIFENKKIEMG